MIRNLSEVIVTLQNEDSNEALTQIGFLHYWPMILHQISYGHYYTVRSLRLGL